MTPLHLAVWFSVRGGTVAPVEALLQYDADICAKDDVRFSPVRVTSLGFEAWTSVFRFILDAFLALVLVLNLFLDILPVRLTSVCYQTWTIDLIFILDSFPEFVLMMNLGHYNMCRSRRHP